MVSNQAYLFLIFTIIGFIIGFLFDFFRILRKSFKTKNYITYIEDIIFWCLTGFIILYSVFIFNNGEIRFYLFLGIGFGVAIYLLVFSNSIIRCSVFIISIFKKFIINISKIFVYPVIVMTKVLKRLVKKLITFLILYINKSTKNIKNFSKKYKKRGDFDNKSRII